MFIMSALAKRGPFHAAKVLTFGEMCNTLSGIFSFHVNDNRIPKRKRQPGDGCLSLY